MQLSPEGRARPTDKIYTIKIIYMSYKYIIYMIKTGKWSPEGIARPTDQSVAQAIRALSPLRAGGSAGVWFDNTML